MIPSAMVKAALPLLLDATWKATVLLLLAFVAALALRRASAGTRHLLWATTMVGLLAIPLLSIVLPAWHLEFARPEPQGWSRSGEMETQDVAWIANGPNNGAVPPSSGTPLPAAGPLIVASRGTSLPSPLQPDIATVESQLPAESQGQMWAGAVWFAGFLASLLWLLGAWVSLARLARGCRLLRDGWLLDTLRQISSELEIKRPVRLLLSESRAIPMTWGVARPVLVLPEEAQSWTPERLRMVLTHELGHVKRWDCLIQVVAHLARGLYWFHPLAWLAVRQLRLEQEHACDDLVLDSGASASEYLEQLLAVTTGRLPAPFAMAIGVGMSRAEKLHRRLARLLDAGGNHRPVRWRAVALAAGAALALILPLGTAAWSPSAAAANSQENQDKAGQQPAAKDSALIKKLSEVQQKLGKYYIGTIDENVLADFALKGLVQGLQDPYSTFLSAEELAKINMELKGTLTGIGVQIQMKNDRVEVITPVQDSPAHKAGIRPGDVIEAIDGKATRGQSLSNVIGSIVGQAGTTVKLKVTHTEGAAEEVIVPRATIHLSTINGFERGADDKWRFLFDADNKVGYLQIRQFGATTSAEVRDAVQSMQKAGMLGLILDLRFCPGGLLEQAVEVSKLFLSKGTIVSTKGVGMQEKSWQADGKNTLGDFPMVVLVNDQTASAAEIVAGALRDQKRAVLVGSRTFGKGSVQMIMKLDEGGAIKVTSAHHYLPSGRNIQKHPGDKSWGVDPSDGYYLPLTAGQNDALRADAQKRGLVGGNKGEATPAKLTPKSIEEGHADPQLAAALRTIVAKLTTGEFVKVGKDNAFLVDQALRIDELRQRREQLQQNMSQVDREIADLQKVVGKGKAPNR